jgi:hypothetical protein
MGCFLGCDRDLGALATSQLVCYSKKMKTVGAFQAKTYFSSLLEEAERGPVWEARPRSRQALPPPRAFHECVSRDHRDLPTLALLP